jgi:hypothetical protein
MNPLARFQLMHGLGDHEAAELVGLSAREWCRQKATRPSRQTSIILLIIVTHGVDFWRTARRANGAQLPDFQA